ncbi:MAG TPA: extradiol ring-cleavage dioxygenase, partial [Alphaproteobacteria bacterium]|nr:extradiol ring-cleavage dioxygenase [Alphaproteobacteria bacterium]
MPLVFAGVCSHAPGIVNRAERADPAVREPFYKAYREMGDAIRASGAEALVVIAAEHFGNFFMENMPAFAIGMADHYEGPIEDPDWMKIERRQIPGNKDLSRRLIQGVMEEVDTAYAEEWKFDHGIMVPLHFLTPNYDMAVIPANINCQGPPLTPLHRAYAFGQAIRHAADALPEKIALIGTGGISHWPATPDSGKINEEWDRDFLDKFLNNRKDDLLSYNDIETYKTAGQGGFEIRTFIAVAGATEG